MIICSQCSKAQAGEDVTAGRISPKELSIPAAPVFDLMGVTPSQVTRTSDIKDFKVDWSFKSYKLNPNIAIQSQPVWEVFFNRKSLNKYQHASPLMRRLASLDVSLGTVQNEDNDRRIGYALKMNLFKEKDPLMATGIYDDIILKYDNERAQLDTQLKILKHTLDTTTNIFIKPEVREQIRSTEEQLLGMAGKRRDEINAKVKVFVSEYWNASFLDVSAGQVYTYQTDSAGSIIKLRVNRNSGWGMWLNGGFGIGKKMLVTGLARTTWYREELAFTLQDDATGEETGSSAIADNTLYSLGLNLRYGNPIFNFFVEFFYEKKSLKTPVQALSETFTAPSNSHVLPTSVNWNVVHPNTMSVGGDWRVSRNIMLNYGMRFVFDQQWQFKTFSPIASISCMMR
jgi:hypothetical protein